MINKRYPCSVSLVVLLFLTLLPRLSSQAQSIRYVKTSPTGSGDGTSWANATNNIQSAINSLTATGGQVWVASGLYKPTTTTGPNSRTISFEMKSKIGIYGGFAGNENTLRERQVSRPSSTTLSGNLGIESLDVDNSYHVLTSALVDSTGLLDGFVITGGNPDRQYDGGGGLYSTLSSVHINSCLFIDNTGYSGSAIYMSFSVDDVFSSLSGNYSPRLTNCIFQHNSAGAIYIASHYTANIITFINCSFQDTSRGIYAQSFRATNTMNLTNCTLQGNQYGAIAIESQPDGGIAQLTNCIVVDNGGNNTFQRGTYYIHYSLLDSLATTSGYRPDVTNVITNTSPFVSATSLQLAPCSPAIDAGDPASTTTTSGATDLAGNPRFVRAAVDMGVYEYQGGVCPGLMYTLRSGRWDDASIWSQGRLPTSADVVHLRHSVTVPQNFVANALQLIYDLSIPIAYETGGRLRLGQ